MSVLKVQVTMEGHMTFGQHVVQSSMSLHKQLMQTVIYPFDKSLMYANYSLMETVTSV